MRRVVAVSLAMLVGLAGVVGSPRADAQTKPAGRGATASQDKPGAVEKQACARAYDDAQMSRKAGKLIATRAQLIACAADGCPVAVRKACSELLPGVDAATPHLTIAAKDAQGNDTLDVRVVVDGAPFADRLVTTAVAIDPGEHDVVFEAPDGTRIEQRVVAREGETKELAVDFSPKAAAPITPPAPAGGAPAVGGATPQGDALGAPLRRGPSPLPWIIGGVGAAGLASFGVFAILGRSKERDLLDHCAPNCARSDVSTMRRDYLIADISLGMAVVAAGVVTWLLVAPSRSRLALAWDGVVRF